MGLYDESDGAAWSAQTRGDIAFERSGAAARHSEARSPSLSVIVPVKDAASHLAGQLEALVRQDYTGEWEIIVVDDGSHDGSIDVARRFRARLPRLRVVQTPGGRGAAFARNYGARQARGDALIFCDADDVPHPQWLRHMGEALRRHDFVAGAIDVDHLNRDAAWRRPAFTGAANVALLFKPMAISCNVGVKRRAFEHVGGFDTTMTVGEDVDFSWRLQLAGYRMADAPRAVMHYRYRRGASSAARQTVRYSIAHVRLYKRFAAAGMPRWPLSWVVAEYRWLLRNATCWLRDDRDRRQEWLQRAAERFGRLLGAIRYRAWYL